MDEFRHIRVKYLFIRNVNVNYFTNYNCIAL